MSNKKQNIKSFLTSTNWGPTFIATIVTGAQLKVPDGKWDKLAQKIDFNTLGKVAENIFDELFSEDDISNLIVFFNTPTGQKLLATNPNVQERLRSASEDLLDKLMLCE